MEILERGYLEIVNKNFGKKEKKKEKLTDG